MHVLTMIDEGDTAVLAISDDVEKLQERAGQVENDLNHVDPENLQDGDEVAEPEWVLESWEGWQGARCHHLTWTTGDGTDYVIEEVEAL